MKQQVSGVGKSAIAVLKALGTGALIVGSIAVPNLASAVAPLLPDKAKTKEEMAGGLRYAIRKGWIGYREADDKLEIYLTKSGNKRLAKVSLDTPLHSRQWDHKWRIVIFDIPSKRRLRRDALRNHLKKVGFQQLQESVWITPFECGDLITSLKLIYKLTNDEVRLITASSFDDDQAFVALFGIDNLA